MRDQTEWSRINARIRKDVKTKGRIQAMKMKLDFQNYVDLAIEEYNKKIEIQLENDKILDEES